MELQYIKMTSGAANPRRKDKAMKIVQKYFYENRVEITERETTPNEVEGIKAWGESVGARFHKTKSGEDAMSYNRITYVFSRECAK